MQKKHIFKKLFTIAFIFILGVILSSCQLKSNRVPYGDLDANKTILKSTKGDKVFDIKEKELYNLLRPKSANILKKLVDNAALEDYVKKIDFNKKEHKEFLTKKLNKTVFGDEKDKNIKFLSKDQIWQKFVTFKNKRNFLLDYPIEKLEQKVTAEILKEAKDRDFSNYENEILKLHQNDLAKRLVVYEYLTEAKNGKKKNEALVDIKKDTNYIDPEKDYLTYYKENMLKWKLSFFAVDLVNEQEFNDLMMNHGVEYDSAGTQIKGAPLKTKSNSNKFYQIPDIRTGKDSEGNTLDFTSAAGKEKYKYLIEYIENDLIKNGHLRKEIKTAEDLLTKKPNAQDFKNYWTNYKFNTSSDAKYYKETEIKIENGDLLKVFVSFYNKLNNTNLTVESDGTNLWKVMDGANEFKTKYTPEEIDELKFKKVLYEDLKFEKKDKSEEIDYTKGTFYSIKPTSKFGDKSFLAYKIWEDRKDIEKVYDFKEKKFKTTDEAKKELPAINKEIKEKIIEKKITDKLVESRYNELLKNKKVHVFDPIIRISFDKAKYTYSTKKYFLDENTIAQVGDKKITVRELYTQLYKAVGIATAISYLSDKFIYEEYKNKLDAKDKEEARKSLENTLLAFSQGRDSGYNPNIGRDLYLQHKFGYATFDEVLEHKFYVDRAKTFFSKDLPNLLPDYYKKVHEIANSFYDKKMNAKVSHILFSVDKDLDGKPDNPNALTPEERAKLEKAILSLIQIIKEDVAKGTKNFEDNLKATVERYKNATRIVKTRKDFSTAQEYDEYKQTSSYIFGEAKKAGLNLKYESIGNMDETSFSKYDSVFFKRVKKLFDTAKNIDEKNFPYVDVNENNFGTNPGNVSFDEIRSNFGWHAINIEKITKTPSAKTDKEYKSELKDANGKNLTAPANPQDKISLEQTETYIKENNSSYGVKITNSTAIKNQLSNILSKLNVYGDLGYILIVKRLNLAGGNKTFEDELTEFKNQLRENFYGNSKYNQLYQDFWGNDLLDKFGL